MRVAVFVGLTVLLYGVYFVLTTTVLYASGVANWDGGEAAPLDSIAETYDWLLNGLCAGLAVISAAGLIRLRSDPMAGCRPAGRGR